MIESIGRRDARWRAWRPLVPALVGAAVAVPALGVDPLAMTPTEVTSGPLLFLLMPEEEHRHEAAYVVDPESGRPPARFLVTPGNLQFLHRVGRDRIVAYSYPSTRHVPTGYYVLDLPAGKAIPILPQSPFGTQLLALEGTRAFVLEHQQKRSWTFGELEAGAVMPTDLRPTDRLFLVDLGGKVEPVPYFDRIVAAIVRHPPDRFWVGTSPPDPALWLLSLDGSTRRKVIEGFDEILSADGDRLWVVAGGASPHLWEVLAAKGSARRIAAIDAAWDPGGASCQLSPDGRRIALAVAYASGRPGRRHLVVLNAESGERACEVGDIRVGLMPDGTTPESMTLKGGHDEYENDSEDALAFTWIDDSTIRFSESDFSEGRLERLRSRPGPEQPAETGSAEDGYFVWIDVDVRVGRRVREELYDSIWGGGIIRSNAMPSHRVPRPSTEAKPPPQPEAPTLLREEWGRVYFAGETTPVGDILDPDGRTVTSAELEVSVEGEWAAFMSSKDEYATWLVDGRKRTKTTVLHGWCHGFRWLPSAATSPR